MNTISTSRYITISRNISRHTSRTIFPNMTTISSKPDLNIPNAEDFWSNVNKTRNEIDHIIISENITTSEIISSESSRYQIAQCIKKAIQLVEENDKRKFITFWTAFIIEVWTIIKRHNATVAQTGTGLLVDFDEKSIYFGDELEIFKEMGFPDIDKYEQWLI